VSGFFSAQDVIELNASKDDIHLKFDALRNRLAARNFKTIRGREYAFNGLIRRLDTMLRCINYVFNTLPPEKEDIPDTDDTVAVTIIIQSFMINVQGCLDNLAWIWVFETKQSDKLGSPLERKAVGLSQLRRTFTKPFQKYLKSRRKWFRHVAEFRDSLAHRIPLYVPPFILSESNAAEYQRLERDAFEVGLKDDYNAYAELKAKQLALGVYRPWMTHSPAEKSPTAVFHKQLLQDFLTIDECALKILDELALFEKDMEKKSSFGLCAFLAKWANALRRSN
jgi:hypothetical protein